MTAHDATPTPGPWKRKRSATGSWLIVPEDYPSFKICRIENAITYIMDFDDAAEADARLIASAPALAEENARLKSLLNSLQMREAEYRKFHDLYGDGSLEAGTAWDRLRKCGDEARAALARKEPEDV